LRVPSAVNIYPSVFIFHTIFTRIHQLWRPQLPPKRRNWTEPIPECENLCIICTEMFWGIITIKPTLCLTQCRNTKLLKIKGLIDSSPVYCKSAAWDVSCNRMSIVNVYIFIKKKIRNRKMIYWYYITILG